MAKAIRSGLWWSLLNSFVVRFATTATTIVLARVLAPDDYGRYAVATVVLTALLSVNELGTSVAIIRWPGQVHEIAPTVTFLAIGTSMALYGVTFAAAPFLSSSLGVPGTTTMIRVLCLAVLVDGVSSVPAALLTRSFRQRTRLTIDLIGAIVNGVLAVALALASFGAWSLVYGAVAASLTSGVLTLAFAPTSYFPKFDYRRCRELLSFGLPLAGSSLLVFAMLNIDYVIVSRELGPTDLGLYALAFNAASVPVFIVSSTIRRIGVAGFARVGSDPALARDALARSLGLVLAVAGPPCVLIAVLAAPVIAIVYGDQWGPAASALRILALVSIVRIVAELCYDFFVAIGRTRIVLWTQGLWFVGLVPALLFGAAKDDFRGVAVGHLVTALGIVVPVFVFALRRVGLGIRGELWRYMLRPTIGSLLVAAAAAGVRVTIRGDLNQLLWGALLAGGTYLPVALAIKRFHGAAHPRDQGGRGDLVVEKPRHPGVLMDDDVDGSVPAVAFRRWRRQGWR